jgi:hypothetical protein
MGWSKNFDYEGYYIEAFACEASNGRQIYRACIYTTSEKVAQVESDIQPSAVLSLAKRKVMELINEEADLKHIRSSFQQQKDEQEAEAIHEWLRS